ncbi:hypothetical protein ACP70R_030470 [Stipagrostis hirtigluma subsp. patula]
MAGARLMLRRLYLSIYNWAVFFGWAQVLYNTTLALLSSGHEGVYAAVERPLLLAQTAALVEILHSVVGFVRSPVSATLPQISARLFVTWGIVWSFPETHSHVFVTSLVLSWSITEVIRYSFFGLKEAFGVIPSWLLWLNTAMESGFLHWTLPILYRYSTFMVFYPIGLVSEVGLIFVALPYMKASEKYSFRMPNKLNFSFDYFYVCAFLTTLYIPVGHTCFVICSASGGRSYQRQKLHNTLQELPSVSSATRRYTKSRRLLLCAEVCS